MTSFKLTMFAARSLAKQEWADKTYEIFDSSNFRPESFDQYEPVQQSWVMKDRFRHAWQVQAARLFGQILLKRKNTPSFLADITFQFGPNRKFDDKPPCHGLSIYQVRESQLVGDTRTKFLSFCDRLFTELAMDYGFLCLGDEYNRKNIIENAVHADGSIEPRSVVGMKWPYCVPGLYWTNFFGERYLEQGFASDARLQKHCGVVAVGKGIRVQTGEDPRFFESEEGRQVERHLREMLGDSWFFDASLERSCHPLDVSLEELRSPK